MRWRSLKVDVAERLVFHRIVAIGVHMRDIYLFMRLTWLVYHADCCISISLWCRLWASERELIVGLWFINSHFVVHFSSIRQSMNTIILLQIATIRLRKGTKRFAMAIIRRAIISWTCRREKVRRSSTTLPMSGAFGR